MEQTPTIICPDAASVNSWLSEMKKIQSDTTAQVLTLSEFPGYHNNKEESVDYSDTPLSSYSRHDSDELDVNAFIGMMIAGGNTLSWCIHYGKGMFKFTQTSSSLKAIEDTRSKKEKEAGVDASTVHLFREIKKWRLELSKSKDIPAFSILYDAVIVDITKTLPTTLQELRFIKGVGPKKSAEYGDQLIAFVLGYKKTHMDNASEVVSWYDPVEKVHYLN